MELREFQKKVVRRLTDYVGALDKQRAKHRKLLEVDPELAADFDFPRFTWKDIGLTGYHSATSGVGEAVPNVCLKVPTGGGKTLLACHAIDLVDRVFRQSQTGLVLWIVPSTQIYSQTLRSLRDRNHPYRQVLDVSSGGRTLILEKTDHFTIDDVQSNLCVLMLMLPSAARASKETLKVFKDNSGFTSFFPAEDDFKANNELVERVPNLDTLGEKGYIYGNIPLTSLGNVLRLMRPLTIVDEGHKAYSKNARDTILGFNPSFVLELSATPTKQANVLAEVSGTELNDEQMIKLDLHLINKHTVGWQETLSEAAAMRAQLETKAQTHAQNTDVYIRPIMLVQVERTGRDQRDGKNIHAEDAKEFLMKQLSVPEDQIAIKSSEKDDIEGIDLLDSDCPIRFIITKQALQEGWDCSFAYVLAVLGRSQSETAMTQLIGRVLRQPYARKTGVEDLDESYVYSFQHDTSKLVSGIKSNLEGEGLGDLAGRIATGDDDNNDFAPERKLEYRDRFKKFEGKIFLPIFAIQAGEDWRELKYEIDLLSEIDWDEASLDEFAKTALGARTIDDEIVSVGFQDGELQKSNAQAREYDSEINLDQVARQLVDVVPNPWVAFEIAERAISLLQKTNDIEVIASNLVFVIEELRKALYAERNRLSETLFRQLIEQEIVKFYILKGNVHSRLPKKVTVRSKTRLNHADGEQLQLSLLDYVPAEDLNELEREVALFMDGQERLLWWYRNMSRADYRIQGWQPGRVYPDFVAAGDAGDGSFDKVFVLETKGSHLAGSEDTEYKRSLLALCNEMAVETDWRQLGMLDTEQDFVFDLVDEESWQSQLNELFA